MKTKATELEIAIVGVISTPSNSSSGSSQSNNAIPISTSSSSSTQPVSQQTVSPDSLMFKNKEQYIIETKYCACNKNVTTNMEKMSRGGDDNVQVNDYSKRYSLTRSDYIYELRRKTGNKTKCC